MTAAPVSFATTTYDLLSTGLPNFVDLVAPIRWHGYGRTSGAGRCWSRAQDKTLRRIRPDPARPHGEVTVRRVASLGSVSACVPFHPSAGKQGRCLATLHLLLLLISCESTVTYSSHLMRVIGRETRKVPCQPSRVRMNHFFTRPRETQVIRHSGLPSLCLTQLSSNSKSVF